MKIQLIIMTKNGSKTIIECLNSFKNYVDKITVFDTGSTDGTLILLKDYDVRCINFTDFSETRNKCLNYCQDVNYKWTIFVDDGHLLVGNLEELKMMPDEYNCASLVIKNNGFCYRSKRIFRTSKKIRYLGAVHEDPMCESDTILSNCYIEDIPNLERTFDRVSRDIEILKNSEVNPRNLYYLGTSYLKNKDTKNGIKTLLDYLKLENKDFEEIFVVCILLGKIHNFSYFKKAVEVFPERCGEAYYYAYKQYKHFPLIKKAYENRYINTKNVRLIYGSNVYEEFITTDYFKEVFKNVLVLLKDVKQTN